MSAGNVKDLPPSTLQALSGEGVAIGRDSGGLYALTLICTHRGCDISSRGSVAFDGITCRCHGATFDRNGNSADGFSPLEHYLVTVDAAGAITIDSGTTVSADQRTPV